MQPYRRPEMELDPAKLPGQRVNRPEYPELDEYVAPPVAEPPAPGLYLRDIIRRMEDNETESNGEL